MSSNETSNQEPEVVVESAADMPSKQAKQVASAAADTQQGEESRDSVVSAEGDESVEGDEDEVGDEEEDTDEDAAAEKPRRNGHADKNGGPKEGAEVNGTADAKNRKRSAPNNEDGNEAAPTTESSEDGSAAQKKKRVEEGQAQQPDQVEAGAE